jgi:dienelactone hydrolase
MQTLCYVKKLLAALLFVLAAGAQVACSAQTTVPAEVEVALVKADRNRLELEKALTQVPAEQRSGLHFLLEHMPVSDLTSLKGDFLLENLALAYKAKAESAWGKDLPDDVFFNDVLPYANINERRDAWRKEFHERFWPIVKDVKTPGLAGAKLNQAIFNELNVKYSTKRRRADQGPRESMESGLASCTGLSILLIDACRACGVPARFVGTPLWSDKSGNHSWVEIWDDGWHFTGAAEANGDELDKAWFADRATTAQLSAPEHSIYAVSFRRTPLTFPMVWDRNNTDVFAINVTERYLKMDRTIPEGFVQFRFRTLGASGPERCQANVVVRDDAGNVVFRGQSKDERFDTNDHLSVPLPKGKKFSVEMLQAGLTVSHSFVADENGKLVTLKAAARVDASKAIEQLTEYLRIPAPERAAISAHACANLPLTKEEAQQALELLAADHREQIRQTRKAELDAKLIKADGVEMPYEMKTFGEKPKAGRSLVISMHGGGGAPKRVNDQQWENQQKLYELEEGIYVAPRAPTDTWNMWHQGHIDALYTRLIEDLIALEDVNPNHVYITGYSAGGDGVFQLAPRMADQLAAAAMMAGHPNETKPDGLRNLPFTLHVGGKDAAYNRNTIAQNWSDQLAELKKADAGGYEHWAKIYPEKGHWMDREDREGVKWMLKYNRNIIPEKVIWLQDDVIHSRFYWLKVDAAKAKAGDLIVASRTENKINVEKSPPGKLTLLLRDDMLNLDEEVVVVKGDKELWRGKPVRNLKSIADTLADRGDPTATFSSQVEIDVPE